MTDPNTRSTAPSPIPALTAWIGRQPAVVLTIFAMIAAFAGYTSMYAFRRPFTATGYDTVEPIALLGISFGYKPIAVISQLVGYTCSKFLGIKFASEATLGRRVPIVVGLVLAAEAIRRNAVPSVLFAWAVLLCVRTVESRQGGHLVGGTLLVGKAPNVRE